MATDASTLGVDLHLDLAGGGRRTALERELREAIRSGRLHPRAQLPSTRSLAITLGISRGTVNAAYEQLIAEGYLAAHVGSGTFVSELAVVEPTTTGHTVTPNRPRYDLRPGTPDVTTFPTSAWLRSMRRVLSAAPASIYGYGDPRGRIELRTALSEYLGRTRGVRGEPDRIVVVSGYVQALGLLVDAVTAMRGQSSIAVEDPGLAFHHDVLRQRGADLVPLPVDVRGARTDQLPSRRFDRVRMAVLTPAHQYPIGVTLRPERRHAAIEWAVARDGVVVEDDYDGEFRYDRQPVGALQGTAPDHIVYVGTASKTLGPALRLAWMVLPPALVEPVVEAKRYADVHTESIGQLTLADLITGHGYDRHVRSCRLRYQRRRDRLAERLRSYDVHGIAAGLHALVTLSPSGPSESDVLAHAEPHGLALGDLGSHWLRSGGRDRPRGIIVGYGTPPESGYAAALDTLARVLRTTRRSR
jgi:GntR family transcriptional regulator/MocR family aminotransferase